MAQGFRDDPAQPGTRVWRQSRGPLVLGGCLLIFLLLPVGVFVWAVASLLGQGQTGVASVMAAMMIIILLLMVLIAVNLRGQAGGSIRLERDGARFRLPANRSPIHRAAAFDGFVRYADMAAVTVRDEAYGAAVNRVYWLEQRGASPHLLFEERGIGSRVQQPSMAAVAAELARAAGLPVTERPMARGGAGFLGIAGRQAPGYDAAPMTDVERAHTWRWVRALGWVAAAAFAFVAAVRLLTAFTG